MSLILTIAASWAAVALGQAPMDGAPHFETVVHGTEAPAPSQDGTSSTTLSADQLEAMPGGTTRPLLDAVAMQPGFTPDAYGQVHVRGNFAGVLVRLDGVPLPQTERDRLQPLLDLVAVDEVRVLSGGLPAEFGPQAAGALDIHTARPNDRPSLGLQFTYGSYDTTLAQGIATATTDQTRMLVAGTVESTRRGLDTPDSSVALHDQLTSEHLLIRADDVLGAHDHVELLTVYSQSNFQVPLDPTLEPLSALPKGAVREPDRYGNFPPPFIPLDANPAESDQDIFGAVSWFHDFGRGSHLQVSPFVRFQRSEYLCDAADTLGPSSDPGASCADVRHDILAGGVSVNQEWKSRVHHFKAGLLVQGERDTLSFVSFSRGVTAATGAGDSVTDIAQGGVYLQDRITLGRLTLLPGVRADVQAASLEGTGGEPTRWGPSVRLGASWAFTPDTVAHAFFGELWQPPTLDAPLAGRVLRLIPATEALPFDVLGETDFYAEAGFSSRFARALTVGVTFWGRISQYPLDDAEVGDTALTAEYNYHDGRAAGAELSLQWMLGHQWRAFANGTLEVAQGQGIVSSLYLFTPAQLAFTGYQTVDNAQLVTANAGADWTDRSGDNHLSGLVRFGSGLRTGPTNSSTLPAYTVVDVSARHRFRIPLRPEVAFDVRNLFDELYAYRISTGPLAGSAYGAQREFRVRLILPWGREG